MVKKLPVCGAVIFLVNSCVKNPPSYFLPPPSGFSSQNRSTIDDVLESDRESTLQDVLNNQVELRNVGQLSYGRCNGLQIGGGYILTAFHCIEGATYFSETSSPQNVLRVQQHLRVTIQDLEVIGSIPSTDLALLRSYGLVGSDATISLGYELKIGDKVMTYPYHSPAVLREIARVYPEHVILSSSGEIVGFHGEIVSHYEQIQIKGKGGPETRINHYETTMPSISGFSGSPVYAMKEGIYRLVGVVTNGNSEYRVRVFDDRGEVIETDRLGKALISAPENIKALLEVVR